MSPDDIRRGSPGDWLRHARSDLHLARTGRENDDVLPETLCFHAQQAAEKALKAVLVSRSIEFARTHNIRSLVELLPVDVSKDAILYHAAVLTDYAVSSRYPSEMEPVTEDELQGAISLAEKVLAWAESVLKG